MSTLSSIIGGTLIILSALACGTRTTEGDKSVESGKALPTIQEYHTQRVVTGTLITNDANEYVVRTEGSLEREVYVDQRTNLDPATAGATVMIYITEEGQGTTVQHVMD